MKRRVQSKRPAIRKGQSKRRRVDSLEKRDSSQSVSLWNDMLYDVGHIILDKLPEVVEHIRFGAVCKQWYSISKEYHEEELRSSRKQQLPMLLVPSPEAPAKRSPPRLYAISCLGKYYSDLKLELPFKRKRFCGSSYGWIAFQDRDGSVTLTYPFGRRMHTILLPPLRDEVYPYTCLDVNKIVISPNSTPNDYHVVAIHEDMKELATIKSGEKTWVYIPPRPETIPASLFSDITFYQGDVYAVSKICMLVKVNIRVRPPKVKVLLPLNRKTSFRKTYLVESTSSELYMLQRRCDYSHPQGDLTTIGFNVFKVELYEGKGALINQKSLKGLNGDTFFVGDNTSIAIQADGCIANSIYFMDDLYDPGYYKPSGSVDIGYYNVQDETIRRFYETNPVHKENVARPRPRPIWIMPNEHTT